MENKNTCFYTEELYKWFLLGVAFSGTLSTFTNVLTAGESRLKSGYTEEGIIYIRRE